MIVRSKKLNTTTPVDVIGICNHCKILYYVGLAYISTPNHGRVCPSCFQKLYPIKGKTQHACHVDELNFFDSKGK